MAQQHILGPWEMMWEVDDHDPDNVVIFGMQGGLRFGICEVFYAAEADIAKANARLIVAAPDYYEGCKDLPQITEGESTTDYDKRVLAWFYNNAGKIHAANKKAEGR